MAVKYSVKEETRSREEVFDGAVVEGGKTLADFSVTARGVELVVSMSSMPTELAKSKRGKPSLPNALTAILYTLSNSE